MSQTDYPIVLNDTRTHLFGGRLPARRRGAMAAVAVLWIIAASAVAPHPARAQPPIRPLPEEAGTDAAAPPAWPAGSESTRDIDIADTGVTAPPPTASAPTASSPSLDALVAEAMRSSPLLAAARARWRALEQAPIQAATLPDPEITVQNLAVGNPLPGNRLQTSNFAYFGYGFSQEVPFPGKLRLKAAEARKQANAMHAAYERSAREVAERIRETYFNLFYLTRSLTLLQRTRDQLKVIERAAEAQYRLGLDKQEDVLKAQIQLTALLKEAALTREQFEQSEVTLKQLLGREVGSPEIEIRAVTPTPFKLDGVHLRELAEANAPALKQSMADEARTGDALALAHEGYAPDLTVGGMYQKTGATFPDYYMLTVSARIPLYFWRRQTPAIKQAALDQQSARAETRANRLAVAAAAQSQWLAVETTHRILTLYNEGLIPQAQATVTSALAGYRTGKTDFPTLLSAAIDLLRLRQEYFRTLADHEIAIAKIRELIGNLP